MLTYVSQRIVDVNKQQHRPLYNCSLRNSGCMWSVFAGLYKSKRSGKIVVCYDHRNVVMGWGIRFYRNKVDRRHFVMLYVRKSCRRRGIGTQLYKKLVCGLRKKSIKVYPDSSNKLFFKNVQNKCVQS